MLEFLNFKPGIFGLDISDSSLKIVKLRNKGEFFSLVSLNEIKFKPGIIEDGVIKDERALSRIIKSACENVKGEKLKTKYAVVSLPEEKSFIQVIQMPKMEESELRSALSFEVENYIPLPISQVYFDFEVIGFPAERADHLDVLVIAMPKVTVDSYVSCLKGAGITPFAMETESQAIVKAIIRNESIASSVVLLNIGEDKTNFIVFSANSIRFTSSIGVPYAKLAESEKKGRVKGFNASNPVLAEFILEINKYMYFYKEHVSHEHSSDGAGAIKIMICGTGSNIKGLNEFLSKKLGAPVETGSLWLKDFLKPPNGDFSNFNKNPQSFITATGLALRDINYKKTK